MFSVQFTSLAFSPVHVLHVLSADLICQIISFHFYGNYFLKKFGGGRGAGAARSVQRQFERVVCVIVSHLLVVKKRSMKVDED